MQTKSNNLIQVITWNATYTRLPSSKMWQMDSCKLKVTVRQPSVGRNLWCCGFIGSLELIKHELLFLMVTFRKTCRGSLLMACFFLHVWERLLGLLLRIWDLSNLNYWVNMRCIIHSFSSKPPLITCSFQKNQCFSEFHEMYHEVEYFCHKHVVCSVETVEELSFGAPISLFRLMTHAFWQVFGIWLLYTLQICRFMSQSCFSFSVHYNPNYGLCFETGVILEAASCIKLLSEQKVSIWLTQLRSLSNKLEDSSEACAW